MENISKKALWQKQNSEKRKRELKRKLFIFSMLFVPVLHFAVFWVYINFSSFVLAFKTNAGAWTLNNFSTFWDSLTSNDGTMRVALENTLKYFTLSNFILMPIIMML